MYTPQTGHGVLRLYCDQSMALFLSLCRHISIELTEGIYDSIRILLTTWQAYVYGLAPKNV